MSDKLVIVLNGQAVVEYDRNKRLPGHQRQFLDKMDSDMDQGIELMNEKIESPDTIQRAQFVAMHLVQSLLQEHDAMTAASCAYLANRLPDLKQVKASEAGDMVSFHLVFDEALNNQVSVQFDSGLSKKQEH